ncbi:hypothetical protein [Pseudomonas sp.]|uniref:hypothetical protein n=1 Tax=Pseudomonas sp. TaxID=306 RepID=UPI0028B060ED|nr:hypothetical protein [Pseudomonas sp.]
MDTPGAAVVGSSVVSFLTGIPQATRETVMLALLMAEHETDQAFRAGLISDWLAYYRNKLKYYGWDAVPPEEAHWPDPKRVTLKDQALEAIGVAAGERHVELMRLAYAGLRDTPPALLQFEDLVRERGSFRLLPCGPAKGNRIDMVVYQEALTAEQVTAGFLFRERQKINVKAELVRFNTRLFEQTFRAKVVTALGTLQYRQIREFQLKAAQRG